jgi:hypothetical protein
MKEKYIPGEGCLYHAHSEEECGCDVDWTPREVYELRAIISDLETRHAATMLHTQSIVDEANELREQRDKLDRALRGLISCIRETSGAAAHNALLNAVKSLAAVKGEHQ